MRLRPALTLLLALVLIAPSLAAVDVADQPASVGAVPVFHHGRVKPLAVAAEEIVYAITGKGHFAIPLARGQGADAHYELPAQTFQPAALVLSWMTAGADWQQIPFLYAPFLPLQHELGFGGEWASPAQVAAATRTIGAVRLTATRVLLPAILLTAGTH